MQAQTSTAAILVAPLEARWRPARLPIRQAMLEGPILPTMLRFALPTLVVLVAQTLVGVVETFYVSFLGTEALAGVALVFPVLMAAGWAPASNATSIMAQQLPVQKAAERAPKANASVRAARPKARKVGRRCAPLRQARLVEQTCHRVAARAAQGNANTPSCTRRVIATGTNSAPAHIQVANCPARKALTEKMRIRGKLPRQIQRSGA